MHLEHRRALPHDAQKACGTLQSEYDIRVQVLTIFQDNCNTEGENNKKGGKYDDQCATWTLEFYKN